MRRGVVEHAHHLPEELVEEILQRLPVRLLLRFKSVCKSWNCLIENPNFVAKHHVYRSNSPSYLLLDRRIHGIVGRPDLSLVCKETFQRRPTDSHLVLPSLPADAGCPQFTRPCNGVVFVRFVYNTCSALYNPATREIKILPEPRGPYPPDCAVHRCSYGYGFDAKSNDYKVVRVTYWVLEEDPDDVLEYSNRTLVPELYSLTLDAWRRLDVKVPAGPFLSQCAGLFSETGMFAWVSSNEVPLRPRIRGRESVVTFDMTDENFTATYLPEVYNTNGEPRPNGLFTHFSVTTLNGSIVMVYYVEKPERMYQVWVLNEIGNPESWTNLYNLQGFGHVLGFLKEDQMFVRSSIIQDPGGIKLILINPVDSTFRYIPLEEEEGEWCSGIKIFEFKESLVKLTRHR